MQSCVDLRQPGPGRPGDLVREGRDHDRDVSTLANMILLKMRARFYWDLFLFVLVVEVVV
eukprot:COSAG02_NODE_44374_length_366_cov_124.314607_1_plen_59_part_01